MYMARLESVLVPVVQCSERIFIHNSIGVSGQHILLEEWAAMGFHPVQHTYKLFFKSAQTNNIFFICMLFALW